ncbi:cysteine desulfurase NifS [bacterium]|nr:cysteine desulfurase NifS [bacterium]
MKQKIYLDHSATTPTDRRVIEAMLSYFDKKFGNPSSLYRLAQEAQKAREEAREKVARLLSAKPGEIVFTGCGTESDNHALKGIAFANKEKGNHIITSSIEHHAVLNTCKWLEKQGFEVTYLEVDQNGIVDLEQLENSITDKTSLISIMHANNELGTIEPLEEIGELAKEKGVYFHTDAVQSVGKIPVNVNKLNADLLSLSAHKLYGPKGVGALYIRKGTQIHSLLHGGHHENNQRAGTENIPGIVGVGKAVEIAMEEGKEEEKRIQKLRDRLEKSLKEKIEDVKLNGHPQRRLPGILNICVRYIEGESMLLQLDAQGIAASSGSACTSGSLKPSHVLTAIGVDSETAHGSLRFSLGKDNTEEHVEKVIDLLPPIVERLREMSPLGKGKTSGN